MSFLLFLLYSLNYWVVREQTKKANKATPSDPHQSESTESNEIFRTLCALSLSGELGCTVAKCNGKKTAQRLGITLSLYPSYMLCLPIYTAVTENNRPIVLLSERRDGRR